MRWCALALLALGPLGSLACGEPDISFESPWEGVPVTQDTLEGAFRATLGAPTPGAGWFVAPGARGHDLARAAVREVGGATWPVLQVQLAGRVESGWHVLELDDERVVPSGLDGVREAVKNPAVVMPNHRRLAVHDVRGTHDIATERLPHALHPETHTEDRCGGLELGEDRHADTGVIRVTGSG